MATPSKRSKLKTSRPAAPATGLPARLQPTELLASGRVQRGPNYQCFVCGKPALRLMPWPANDPARSTPLDEWQEHIGYLQLTCRCAQKDRGASRVAVLGEFIAPLAFTIEAGTWAERQYANIQAVRQALLLIATSVPEAELRTDPVRYIVYCIMTGHWPPAFAMQQIRQLIYPDSMQQEKKP